MVTSSLSSKTTTPIIIKDVKIMKKTVRICSLKSLCLVLASACLIQLSVQARQVTVYLPPTVNIISIEPLIARYQALLPNITVGQRYSLLDLTRDDSTALGYKGETEKTGCIERTVTVNGKYTPTPYNPDERHVPTYENLFRLSTEDYSPILKKEDFKGGRVRLVTEEWRYDNPNALKNSGRVLHSLDAYLDINGRLAVKLDYEDNVYRHEVIDNVVYLRESI